MRSNKLFFILFIIYCLGIILSAIAFSSLAYAGQLEDAVRFTSAQASFVDMTQTLEIHDHEDIWEVNPLLGSNPSDFRVVSHFLLTGILFDQAVQQIKNPKLRIGLYALSTLWEGYLITHNDSRLNRNNSWVVTFTWRF